MPETTLAPWTPTQERLGSIAGRIITALNVWVFRLTGGRLGGTFPGGAPVCLVTAKGKRSGASRTVALLYLPNGDDLVLIAADVPGSLAIEEIRVGRLPREWRRTPAPEALARLGTQWVRRGRTAVLAVPSAVVPVERNYLLNPMHPDFRAIVVRRAERCMLDPRMWK